MFIKQEVSLSVVYVYETKSVFERFLKQAVLLLERFFRNEPFFFCPKQKNKSFDSLNSFLQWFVSEEPLKESTVSLNS